MCTDDLTSVWPWRVAESNGQVVPSLGSGVVYFNDTIRAMHLARAWAEAMAYKENHRAPDDQVLTTMCSQGGWIKRASWGWLPVAYLRMMPAFCATWTVELLPPCLLPRHWSFFERGAPRALQTTASTQCSTTITARPPESSSTQTRHRRSRR